MADQLADSKLSNKKRKRGRKAAGLALGEKVIQILSNATQTLDFYGEFTYKSYPYLYSALGKVQAKDEVNATLNALARKGLIEFDHGEKKIRLTFSGAELQKSLYQARLGEWDRKWRVVIFDIPERFRNVRNDFRYQLKKLSFALWQRSVWITPFDIVTAFEAYLAKNNLSSYVQVVVGERFGGQSDREFAAKLWDLEKINRKYVNFLKAWERELQEEHDEKERLGVVRKLHSRYLDITSTDPHLPQALLPVDWQGDQSIALFEKLQSALALDKG